MGLEHEKTGKIQVPQQNEMLSFYMQLLVLLVKMKNIISNKK